MMKRTVILLSFLLCHLWPSQAQLQMFFSADSLSSITSPLDLDSLFYWFAADVGVTDSLGGAIATDEGVGTWNDLSGNGHHVTQSTNGARPVYKATGGPGSKPCIQFDGSNDFLASAAHFWGSDDLTIFVVMKFANATRDATEVYAAKFTATGDKRQWTLFGLGTANSYRMQNNTYPSGTTASAGNIYIFTGGAWVKHTNYQLHVFTNTGTSGAATQRQDGSAVSVNVNTTAAIYDATEIFYVGAQENTGVTNFLQGSISEIIVYSRALTATERTAIELYLNRKYDLY